VTTRVFSGFRPRQVGGLARALTVGTGMISALLALSSAPAFAESGWTLATSRLPDARGGWIDGRAEAWAGSPELGMGLLHPRGLGAEAALFPLDGVLEFRAGRVFPWVRWERFGLAAFAGATLVGVLRGPVDLGLGPHVGLVAGWTWSGFQIEGGLTVGAEGFARSFGPRIPARFLLRLGPRFETWDLLLSARTGADFEPGLYFRLRYQVTVGIRILLAPPLD
jgi:hypothetical protein